MKKNRKYKVKHAKIISWLFLIPSIIIMFLSWDFFEIMIDGAKYDYQYKLSVIFRFFISFFIGASFYLSFLIFIWNKLQSRKDKHEVIRFWFHYNKCVEAFDNMDLQKVKTIYENRLKDVEVRGVSLQPLKDKIKFGYNVISGRAIKEKLKLKKEYEK